MADAETCGNCRFFSKTPASNTTLWKNVDGVCRRYAPQGMTIATPLSGGYDWSLFPPMTSTNWCGDYRPANQAVDNIQKMVA